MCPKNSAQTLTGAIHLALSGEDARLAQAVAGLAGQPAPYWWDGIVEAMSAIRDALPPRSERDFSLLHFLAVVCVLEDGVYRLRGYEEAMAEARELESVLGEEVKG
jgi:hypothetical protein